MQPQSTNCSHSNTTCCVWRNTDLDGFHCYSVSLDAEQLNITLTGRQTDDGKMEGTYT